MSEESEDTEKEESVATSTHADDDGDAAISQDTLVWTGFASEDEEASVASEEVTATQSAPTAGMGMKSVGRSVMDAHLAEGRYVPPHLRNKAASADETEALAKLSRLLKGLLNRYGEVYVVGARRH